MVTTARLLTASATTGWRDWIHGQLWLLDGGLLRVATDLRTTLRQGAGPTVPGDEVVTADITRAEAEAEAARHRRSVWVSREEIDSAVLRGGLITDSLRLRLRGGRSVKFLWLRHDAAYGPLKEALRAWLGPGLRLKGRKRVPEPPEPAGPASLVLAVVVQLAVVAVLVALYAGWLDPLLGSDATDRGCDQLASVAEDYRDTPEPGTQLHPLATHRARTDIDRALQAFLLDSVDHGTYVRTHEHFWDLDGHVETQHNPDARELAASHGFVRQVSRQWTDEDGNHISHVITQLSSARNAESFNLRVARYSCRFAEDLRRVELDDEQPPVIGQRILYRGGAVAEQISWTRDGRRHLLAVHDLDGHPDRDLLEQLFARAHPRDDGSDIMSPTGSATTP